MPRSLPGRQRRSHVLLILAALAFLLVFGRSICSLIVDYFWWREMDQVATWVLMSAYRYGTGIAEWLIIFAVMWIAHARGMKYADTSLRDHPQYARIMTAVLAVLGLMIAAGSMSGWTVARYVAGSGLDSTWHDPVFGRPLSFFFFDLPFYDQLVGFLETIAVVGTLAYYLAARGWQIRREFPHFATTGQIDWTELRALGRLETGLLQFLIALFLVGLAVSFWLGRYDLEYSDHGTLLVGIDYVQQHVGLLFQNLKAGAALLAAALVLARRRKLALACAVVLVFDFAIPPLVSGLYVKPNELALEKPYLERHIEATRSAFGLGDMGGDQRVREVAFEAHKDGKIDFARNQGILDNVRLWDWRAFHDTLSQTQPLRPYAYAGTDVDRYQIDGQLRQVLLAPREMDVGQLGDATSWININLTFTHGYGLVLAVASEISPAGLPNLLIRDAPVEVETPSLKLTRPEIYYGETSHEPVFVRTDQPEFNYPSESGDKYTTYDGTGGFSISSEALRVVSAIAEGDWNIALSGALTPNSRMMIHRRVIDRLSTLAPFLRWDNDPYLVITKEGRLVWIADGYMTSSAHPYARSVSTPDGDSFNYIRNSVKATVDAYNGTVHLYVFDNEDPLIRAYQRLFPSLFSPESAMPADLRAHARAPEDLFRIQAEMYRTYHMRNPESFYNRADMWDLATSTTGQTSGTQIVTPTYIVATLPGETQPEFLLTIPFTPRNKQNLIGMMVARCDGPHLGEVVVLELPKQEIIPGPLQIEALVNQDQTISKDLSLWNQQGSQVLRPPILTLPIDHTFLYVAPIFIQAAEARIPQLRKVVLAVGNTLVYENTYQQARAALEAIQQGQPAPAEVSSAESSAPSEAPSPPAVTPAAGVDPRIAEIRMHLDRYKQLSAQGRWAEAGKELEAIQQVVKK